jgi:pimeloyl-ACP methyl ester carboxylesterase/cephalosporin-C deacetylase-like acetyl esterase
MEVVLPDRLLRTFLLLLFLAGLPLRAAPPAPPTPPATGFVPVPGGKLYYEVAGEGPALVLVHDGLVHSVTWDGQFPVFARTFRTIRYDRRGYGRSETTTRDFSAVDDLLAVLDALKVDRATVVGCSSGGGLSLDFTLAHPERVSALVVEGAVVSGLDFSGHFYERNLANFRPVFQAKDVAKAIDAWATDPYLTAPTSTVARARLREVLTTHPHQVDGSLPDGKKPERPAAGRLREIHAPTLVLVGAADIPDVQAHAGALQAGIASARREVLSGAGHLAHLEQPERFNEAVLDFLRPEDEAARYQAELSADRTFDYDAARHLFDYDPRAPLDVREAREAKIETRAGAQVVDLSYASPLGGRVPAYLVLPAPSVGPAKHPAAVFVHLGQGNRGTFLDEAVGLAGRGLVSLLLGAPSTRPEHVKGSSPFDGETDRRDFVQTAVDVRRGYDLLAARPEVDPARLGYVGHSLGATIGGPLLALEPRVRAWVLMAGFAAQTEAWAHGKSVGALAFRNLLTPAAQERYRQALAPIDTVRFLSHAPRTPVLFQFARRDEYISPWDAALYVQATPGPKEVIWYDTGHTFDADAREDRDAWLVRQLESVRPPAAAALFTLRSGFWINLHNFLYGLGRRGEESPAPAAGGPLTGEERRAWEGALATYRREYARRDYLFDREMARINTALGAAGGSPSLPGAGLPPPLVVALQAAAPVYRAHWWPTHDAANRGWIAEVTPRLERYGPAIAKRLAQAYRVEWPAEPIPVDVTVDAGRVGAYTTDDPTHVTLSSVDPSQHGDLGLESLFHEASHGWDQKLIDGVAKAAASRSRPAPESLWHALLFYTVGEATRSVLAAGGNPNYIPFAVRNSVYDRGPMRGYPPAMKAAWQPYLDGKTDFASALRAVIDALPAPQETR